MAETNGGAVDEINALKQQVIEVTKRHDDLKETNTRLAIQVEELKADRDKWRSSSNANNASIQKLNGESTAYKQIIDELIEKLVDKI